MAPAPCAMESMRVRAVVVASRQTVVISASTAMQTLTPRQPIHEPTQAASGTPTRSVSDWPLITQPSARPCWVGRTRDETSVNTVPLNRPQNPPAIVPQTATREETAAGRDADRRHAQVRAVRRSGTAGCPSDRNPRRRISR